MHTTKKKSGAIQWINNIAARHLKKAHPESPASKLLIKSDADVNQSKIETMLVVGTEMVGQKRSKGDKGYGDKPQPKKQKCTTQIDLNFTIDPAARAICSQALC